MDTAHAAAMGKKRGIMARPRVTHCKRGHEYTPDNTVRTSKGRSCRICRNANAKIRYNASEEMRIRMNASGARYRERMKQAETDSHRSKK